MTEAVVGREDELAALYSIVTALGRGDGAALGLIGASGMGKSLLLRVAADMAAERGVRVVAVACQEAERMTPLATAARVTAAMGLDPGDGPDALRDAIVGDARASALLVLLDDLQWLDSASLPTVLASVHATMETRVGVVLAARPPTSLTVPLQRVLAALERHGVRTRRLAPLSDAEVERLLTGAMAASPIDDEQRSVLATAAGNPLLVLELAHSWEAGHRPGADSVLMHTLPELSNSARRLLERASVFGREARIRDLAHMSSMGAADLTDDVREATASGLVDASGDSLRFRHDLIRDALYASVPSAVRAALHVEAARALDARGAPAIDLALHLVEGAHPGDMQAIEWLRAASADAASADLRVASALLESARRLCPDDSPVADDIDRRRVSLLAWTGRHHEAIEIAGSLLSRTTPGEERARLQARLAEALARGGDEAGGAREAERALETEGMTDRTRAGLLVLVATGAWQTDPVRCRDLTAHALRLAPDDVRLRIAALQHDAMSFNSELALESFKDTARAATQLARRIDADRRSFGGAYLFWSLLNEAEALIGNEVVDEALRLVAEAEHSARRSGLAPTVAADLAAMRSEAHLVACRWDDALAEAEARAELLAEMDVLDAAASGIPLRVVACRARIAALTGEPAATTAIEGWGAKALPGVESTRVNLWRAHLHSLGGSRDQVRRLSKDVARSVREFRDSGRCAQHVIGWQATWLDPVLALWTTDRRDAELILDVMRAPLAANPSLPRWLADGCVAAALGTGDARHLDRGLALAPAIASPQFRFRLLVNAWRAALLLESPSTARQAEDAAATAAAEHGFALPGTSRQKPDLGRPVTGWASLTPSEKRVSRLVADGLSNKAIAEELMISRYTVETHLKRVFQKLHVRSRVELGTYVVRAAPED